MSDSAIITANVVDASAITGNVASGATITSNTTQAAIITGTVTTGGGSSGGVTDHTLLTNIGTNTHAQIDTALTRLAATSGTNTGDETLTSIKTKLGITTLSGSNTGDQDLSSYATTSALTTGLAARQLNLSITAVKTAAYTAAANEFVPVDTTSAAVTITFPTAPADGTLVGAKMVIQGGTNIVTVATGGSDVLNKTGGNTSATLTYLNQSVTYRYKSSVGIWYGVAGDIGLTALDTRYQKLLTLTTTGTSGAATLVGTTLNIPSYTGGGSTTTNNYNTTKIDQSGGGTTTYGALGGLVNGTNAVFTVSNGSYVSGTLSVMLNGQDQTLGSTGDFTETSPGSGTFTFATAPPAGAVLIAMYITTTSTSGNLAQPYATKTAAYSINGTTDRNIFADATTATFAVNLPSAVTSAGFEYYIIKVDASVNAVTFTATAGSILGGVTSLAAQFKHVTFISNGTNWYAKENN